MDMVVKTVFRGFLFTTLILSNHFSTSADITVIDKIVAVVDKDVVLQSELDQRMERIYSQIAQSGTQAPSFEILQRQVLEQLISERIQLNIGFNAGVRITDSEINDALARLASNAKVELPEYLKLIRLQQPDIEILREQIRREIVVARVQQNQVMRRIRISERELDNFLRSEDGRFMTSPDVNIGQILLGVQSNSDETQLAVIYSQAKKLYERVQKGEDFRNLAISFSDDQTALEGGNIGWRKLAQLPYIFIEALKNMQIGETSPPIKSNAGYHLIKLYDRRGGDKKLIEQHFARHILMTPNQIRNEENTIDSLISLREQINGGADFGILAKQNSEDSGSSLSGGELGWSAPGLFVPEFEQVMYTIPLNEVSQPFQSPFGWHILQVTARRKQDFSNEILRNKAENILSQRKYEQELRVWLQQIRDEAFIEIKAFTST
ncbi:MAG: molecular chaperone SurA [Porticoccaceae bacterium]|nr:molecular chaperone SurA [Porticoccaceae bacterium]